MILIYFSKTLLEIGWAGWFDPSRTGRGMGQLKETLRGGPHVGRPIVRGRPGPLYTRPAPLPSLDRKFILWLWEGWASWLFILFYFWENFQTFLKYQFFELYYSSLFWIFITLICFCFTLWIPFSRNFLMHFYWFYYFHFDFFPLENSALVLVGDV